MELELAFAKQIQKLGWELLISQEALIIEAPSQLEACRFVRATTHCLARWAVKLNCIATLVRYPGCRRPYRIPAAMAVNYGEDILTISTTPLVTTSSWQIGEMQLSPELLKVFERWIENPEIKGGIIRLGDERQIVLSQASAAICQGSLEEACRRKREDYWYLKSLELMRQQTQQESSFLFTWYSTMKRPDGFPKFTSQYRVIKDSLGNTYQVSENVGFDLVRTLPTAP